MFSATPTPPPLLLGESCGAFGTSKKAPQRPPPPHQRPEVSTNHLGLGFWRESPPKRRCVSAKGSAGCREAGGHRRAGGQRCGDPRGLWEPRAGLRAAAAAAQGGSRCHPLVLALLESPGTAEKRPEGSAPQTPGEFLQQGQGVCCYQLLLSAAFPNISCFSAPKKLFPFFFFFLPLTIRLSEDHISSFISNSAFVAAKSVAVFLVKMSLLFGFSGSVRKSMF